ncbi:twin-arginine translocase subunit TatC [Halalkalibacterium halodurans]|uniref:Sec-independent protein translocase protein TatC n=1 Tax=Halalkalibacterium halodurans TaxID=86665 RepID=A0A0M0KDT8_ALKHA|nr:twin-arginine translocase subunit TatC [Halalkalibacterium halodurans]MDY7221049.1 twin-arginine translocase subunit TatC [Halalkalibacterium halodurans]MDY7240288.1 twin-arginine translocase subunit TatC [Halalkalibacterium halodurans]MED3645447.1 twin-arginine translocase subunit TatC [Halalkalibacterium halodurans]MED4079938.1 twin-arginine translocase subunit TatC [Halalkalibacterium halodurans]MED4086703.1 twin-arginine translocase subunit TatC [Halalkalibacterium halodurans]
MNERDMSLMDHIAELRRRILIIVVFFAIALVVGFFLATPMITYLQGAPTAQDLPMNAFKLTDPLRVYMTFAFTSAFILVFPIILYQLWAFVSPGLHENERKATLAYIPIAFFLFLGGLSFAYFILFPFLIQFIGGLAERLHINELYGINEYFTFLFQITMPFGVLFQLPVVVMFLTRLGIVTPEFLRSVRKYAFFVLLVVAGFITPPELISHLMVTVPLLLLYEFSIWVSHLTYRKVQKLEKLRQEEYRQEEG